MLLYFAHHYHRWSDIYRTADHCRHAHACVVASNRFSEGDFYVKHRVAASQPHLRRSRPKEYISPDQRNFELFTAALYLSLSFSCPSLSPSSLSLILSLTPRVWNHSEVVLVLSPPTSHLLNEPSIDRRHFAVSRFPSHLAAAPALPPFRSLISSPAMLPLSGGSIDLIFSLLCDLRLIKDFFFFAPKERDPGDRDSPSILIFASSIEVA